MYQISLVSAIPLMRYDVFKFRPKKRGKVKNNSVGDICDMTKNVIFYPFYGGIWALDNHEKKIQNFQILADF